MPFSFDFDPAKSKANLKKHGIDFREAQRLWESKVLEVLAKNPGETRYLCFGLIDGKYWTAIVTYRGAARRLISVRTSTDAEKEFYESRIH